MANQGSQNYEDGVTALRLVIIEFFPTAKINKPIRPIPCSNACDIRKTTNSRNQLLAPRPSHNPGFAMQWYGICYPLSGTCSKPGQRRRSVRTPKGNSGQRPTKWQDRRIIPDDLHSCSGPGRQGSEEPGGQLVRKKAERVMRKPYKTLDSSQMSLKPLERKGLHENLSRVLSGSKNPKRVYLETI